MGLWKHLYTKQIEDRSRERFATKERLVHG